MVITSDRGSNPRTPANLGLDRRHETTDAIDTKDERNDMNFSERWTTFRGFLSDVKKETSKVSWPDRDEVVGTTMVVIVYTILVGIFLVAAMVTLIALVPALLLRVRPNRGGPAGGPDEEFEHGEIAF